MSMTRTDRRNFLQHTGAAVAATLTSSLWLSNRAQAASGTGGPYGALRPPDANGLRLPVGFRSRVIATTREPVGRTGFIWHLAPDGGACIAKPGGYYYVSNCEMPFAGGASCIEFDDDGNIVAARSILRRTSINCAGGATPWGTWLSCEEWFGGKVHECFPDGRPAIVRPALGRFTHEAVAVETEGRRLYLTEDRPDGRFYRFTPRRYPDLSEGLLEAAAVTWNGEKTSGRVRWVATSQSMPASLYPPTRATTTEFKGGEGCFADAGIVYFTTKGDNRVWLHDPNSQSIECIYSSELFPHTPIRGVDNIVVARSGDLFVGEDGGSMQLGLLTPSGEASAFLQVVGHDGSEITGPAFDPSGTRLYFSSQRGRLGGGVGVTFEVTGPFRA